MTVQQPETMQIAERDVPATELVSPDTAVISLASAAPVFVDTTGRRSRRLRRLAYAFSGLVMLYGGLISVSLAGGPVRSGAVLPLPGLESDITDNDRAAPRPSPNPAPSETGPSTAAVLDNRVQRRMAGGGNPAPQPGSPGGATKRAAAPTRSAASGTPKPTSTVTKPTEATPAPSSAPATSTPPVMPTQILPVPPGGGTGGRGGGGAIDSTSPLAAAELDPAPVESAPERDLAVNQVVEVSA